MYSDKVLNKSYIWVMHHSIQVLKLLTKRLNILFIAYGKILKNDGGRSKATNNCRDCDDFSRLQF